MHIRTAALVVLVSAVASSYGFQSSVPNRPWPPEVQSAGPESPPLAPAEALKSFYMPPGFRVELVASEPLVQEPVAMDWDVNRRLWVVEMPGFMADLRGSTEHDPIGRIVVLEDTDDDGRMDRRTVFADKLVLARSIKVLERGVLVAEPPNVWLMTDTDGDLKMDGRTLVTDQYGRFEADPQNNANGLYWALDNRMHTAGQSNIHLRWQGGTIGTVRQLQRGEWGVTQDDAGRIYRNTNESALHVDLVPTFYYARNPNLLRTRGSYDRLATENEELNIVWPARPNPGTNRAYQAGIDRADGTLIKFTSVCAPTIYRGDRLPADVYGNVFVAEPAANLVSRLVLEEGEDGLTARKAYPRGEFLASTDERFRPVYLSNAPDGTLYIADMYRGIIEHRISITEYLRDQILERGLDRGTGYGRIYRVMHDAPRDRSTALTDGTGAVAALSHPNGWWRETAQRLLVERGERAVVPALSARTSATEDWRTRLHAMWTLDGLDALDSGVVTDALADVRPEIRTSAVRLAERWLSEPGHPVVAAVKKLVNDRHWWVRQQLAASLGFLPAGPREETLDALLRQNGEDPVLLDAALSSLRGSEPSMLARMMERPALTPAVAAATTMLAATIVRGGEDAAIQRLLRLIAQEGSEWQRSAVLRGVEVAVLGAPMPGNAPGRAPVTPAAPPAPASPCPTCPGGRAGPGGAYAFPRPSGWPAGRARATLDLHVTRAPTEFMALAAADGSLGDRAKAVLAKIVWPGKAGAPAAAAPLSPLETRRFEEGRELYRNVCQGCHQPDGRGTDRIAPALVGSALALGPAEIPARVLLHGKEGAVGLMPPIGASFSDQQVAAVLTYIRREWGHSASAVTARQVALLRQQTKDRSRPWRDDELFRLLPPNRQ